MSDQAEPDTCGCSGPCDAPSTELDRRQFLKLGGGLALGAAMSGSAMPLMAGPFEDENEYLKIIPQDKRLDPAWVRSLFERGEKQAYTNDELKYIGMPVGGIGAGTVYLGGDGRLWLWDIFNKPYPRGMLGKGAGGENYLEPLDQVHPFKQGVSLRVELDGQTRDRSVDRQGFSSVTFEGRYPMGRVRYRDRGCPVGVDLEAFSPFVPLDLENSSYPATVMRYTLRNTGDRPLTATLAGWTENPVCLYTGDAEHTRLRNAVQQSHAGHTCLLCTAQSPPDRAKNPTRPDVVFADFEKPGYADWTAEGKAFGVGPVAQADAPAYQGKLNFVGKRGVNSHATAPGDGVRAKDRQTGTLTSKPFAVSRKRITFRIGGGRRPGLTALQLLVDGKVVRSATGRNQNAMRADSFDVTELQGKTATLRIVDKATGDWGNIGVDHIVFTDTPSKPVRPLTHRHDYGSFALAIVDGETHCSASFDEGRLFDTATDRFEAGGPFGQPLTGVLRRSIELKPGASATVSFVYAWHFANTYMPAPFKRNMGRAYAGRFADAGAAAMHVATRLDRLYTQTKRWADAWYDSSLPYWLLDRAMANTSILATSTCYLFGDGRFYGWEGVNCCPGTCTHVWHYAQAPGRLFPQIERGLREEVDFGLALADDGGIRYRGELHRHTAVDGQCGRILGVLREHQMSPDDGLLKRLWPKVRKAIEFMMAHDPDADGLLDKPQYNTLDATWYGRISFTSSLYLAALRAGEVMANEAGDPAFAQRCKAVAERGAQAMLELYNGEYFVQVEDPNHTDKIGIGPGCYIDQVFGQTWAHWVGVGRLFDRDKQLSALRALWKYNFVPDVGPFRERFKKGRWYAKAGDAGLLMCTWPKGGKNPKFSTHWQYMYFNECMTGFEWQVAAHMIYEGHDQPDLLRNGLAIARAIHDRYDGRLRNPYNEIECSDHYARAMASYGAYQAVCGFECDGPNEQVGFDPRLTPDDFRCAFVTAEGWGTYAQRIDEGLFSASIEIAHGRLKLRQIKLNPGKTPLRATVNGHPATVIADNGEGPVVLRLAGQATVRPGKPIRIELQLAALAPAGSGV